MMVVANDNSPQDPARKRPRLSLRGRGRPRKVDVIKRQAELESQASQDVEDRSINGNSTGDIADQCDRTDLPLEPPMASPDIPPQASPEMPYVPPVTSLENLGNTCFMNSVLQILRYTPSFLHGLSELYHEIIVMENIRKKYIHKEDEEMEKSILSQELVKQLFKLYKCMEKRESNYREIASADITCMAVKPDRVLDIIREINPMFEGNLQHDAQELLRCLLCYLEEAERELHQSQTNLVAALPPRLSPKSPINPIMQRFLSARSKREAPTATKQSSMDDKGDASAVESIKCRLFTEGLSEGMAAVNTVSDSGELDSNKAELNSESIVSVDRTMNRELHGNKTSRLFENGLVNDDVPCRDSKQVTVKAKPGRKRSCDKNILVNNSKKKNDLKDCKFIEPKSDVGKSQRSILSMFPKTNRRLGMRGHVVKVGSEINAKLESENNTNGVSPSEISSCFSQMSCKSPSKSQAFTSSDTGISGCNVDPMQPIIKLEKCDRVCNSRIKSVKTSVALKVLGDVRLKDDESVLVTGQDKEDRGDLVLKPLLVRLENGAPQPASACLAMKYLSGRKIAKIMFVERLFQGTMMLRTRCLECESFRERKEEFQDVSVPLKRDKESSDEEDSETEDDDSCLSKLMSAFSEVERLREDNKYFCDFCNCYVEAERSLHYDMMPDVLTLHLKRFAASAGSYGYVSKINDHVTIPLSLPCLRYKCTKPCCKPEHTYCLYGIITHTGVTISGGHYLSYIRMDELDATSSNPPLANFVKTEDWSSKQESAISQDEKMSEVHWFECDDESIRVHDDHSFMNSLASPNSYILGTPYVLFYKRTHLK